MRNSSLRDELKAAAEDDYQNTLEFKKYMGSRMENFITMAVGGPLWYDREYGYSYNYDDTAYGIIQESVVESLPTEYSDDWYYNYYGDYYDDYYDKRDSANRNKEAANRMHENMKNDKNILYIISYEGKELYSNVGDLQLNGRNQILPEGYNFLMYFDGKTVKIVKDGKEIDVYGDGYYREEDYDWYVPGYKNFVAEGNTQKAEITIAVTNSPVTYVSGNYGNSNRYNDSRLYWIEYNMKQSKKDLAMLRITIIAAVILLIVYILLRKYKKEADILLARRTARLWYDVKVLILIFGLFGAMAATRWIWNDYLWMMRSGEVYIFDMIFDMARAAMRDGTSVLILFWICYLLINESRYTLKPWRNSLTYRIVRYFKASELKLPFQKRMMRRSAPIVAAEISLIVFTVILYLTYSVSAYGNHWGAGLLMLIIVSVLIAAQVIGSRSNKTICQDMGLLIDQIDSIRQGNLTEDLKFPEDADLREAAENLNDIQAGLNRALEDQIKSERMKVELVSNVSHDVKTPLTSIISYIDLLKQEDGLPAYIKDYVNILDLKSQRLKSMVQDVFEVSKAASGQLPVSIEVLDFGKLLRQTLADMAEKIEESTIVIKTNIPENPVIIRADGQRLYRVFQNLLQNAIKYSLDGSRVYVELRVDGTIAAASIKNTSKNELTNGKDYTERFARGDDSRTDGGSGLGLSIAKSFTEACGGIFGVKIIADLFVCTVEFNICEGSTPHMLQTPKADEED